MTKFNTSISRNQYNVLKNFFQTDAKKVLCVCSAACLRAPTASNVLHKEYGYNTRAAGVSVEYAIVPVTASLLEWADEIVVMESWQAHEIEEMYKLMSRDCYNIKCLNIPDNYSWMEDDLVELIKSRYEELLEKDLENEDE